MARATRVSFLQGWKQEKRAPHNRTRRPDALTPHHATNAPLSQKLNLATNTKPIMFIFTQPGCSACAALKAQLSPAPQATSALSRMFHVVHVGKIFVDVGVGMVGDCWLTHTKKKKSPPPPPRRFNQTATP